MVNFDFLLSGFLFLLDFKENLLTGPKISERFSVGEPGKSVYKDRVNTYYTNPLINENTPDPGVTKLLDNSGWALVSTSSFASKSNKSSAFPIYFSRDLVSWSLVSWVFSPTNWPAWAQDNMWAPELHAVRGRYIVYFTARGSNGRLACGAAIALSDDPFGRYKDIGRPLVEAKARDIGAGAIDPHYFNDPVSGRHYLLWKEDRPISLQLTSMYIQELKPSGTALTGARRLLLSSNLVEERQIAEAPWMMYKNGYYYLFYSSGWFLEAKYHMRVARGKKATGPFIKRNKPILSTDWARYSKGENCSFLGPGHGSVIEHDGDWWMLYHSWLWGSLNDYNSGRVLLLDKMIWKDSWPVVGVPSDTPQIVPAVNQE